MSNKKITIKDIISEDLENEIVDNTEKPKDRMVELMESFEQKDEIIKEKTKKVDSKKLDKELSRLKKISGRIDEANQLNYYTGNVPAVMNNNSINTAFNKNNMTPGQTINTAFANNQPMANNSFNPNSIGPHNPNYSYLQPVEAVRLAISRTLNSGAPVNDLGFYEEVNRELNILGFNAKSPLDIKQTILKMIKD